MIPVAKKTLLNKFLAWPPLGGIALFIAAMFAVLFSNTSAHAWYEQALNVKFAIHLGRFNVQKPFFLWVNDGLMAIFFLFVGLEIKHEILQGRLSKLRQAALPALGAMGGLILPALIYVGINHNDPQALKGWAIPAATDIAFSLGILSLLGNRISFDAKVFLTALAILDDIAAIIIIALFYTSKLSVISLLLAAIAIILLFLLNRMRVTSLIPYFIVGGFLWMFVLNSGVHATLAGIILAFMIPLQDPVNPTHSPLHYLMQSLDGWVKFLVLPTFAFVNSGIDFRILSFNDVFYHIPFGIMCGLFFGKQLGIFFACWLSIKLGIAEQPRGINWSTLYGIAVLCGVGFTMSLFIGSLAFGEYGKSYTDLVKLGVLMGSSLSGIVGFIVLYLISSRK
ncbi:MAG: Na+/H+ antiporter NhaA [Gammaproteobacteria bacterium]